MPKSLINIEIFPPTYTYIHASQSLQTKTQLCFKPCYIEYCVCLIAQTARQLINSTIVYKTELL